MKKLAFLAVAAGALVSGSASAADIPFKAPPKAVWGDSWAGYYFGVYFGAGAGRATESFTQRDTGSNFFFTPGGTQTSTSLQLTAGNLAGDMTGSMVELFAGYNWRIGNFVVGGQAEGTVFSDVSLKTLGVANFAGTAVQTTVVGGVTTTATQTFSGSDSEERNDQLRSNFGVIGRVGYLVTPDILLYGLGGLALGHFVETGGGEGGDGRSNKWVAGYTAGAGGEVRLNEHWSLRAEYRYLHFDMNRSDETSFSNQSVQGTTLQSFSNNRTLARDISADFHLGKVGVVYRFGPGGPASAMAAIPAALGTSDSWAGFYFGTYFGAGAGRAKESFTENQVFSERGVSPGVTQTGITTIPRFGDRAGDMTGSMVELFAGYNWRIGNFVVGGQVEGTIFSDVSLKTIGLRNSASSSVGTTVVGGVTTTTTETNSILEITERNEQLRSNVGVVGRVGFLATPNVLLYGLGGLALGHFVHPDGDDLFGGKNGKWVAGYTAGAGGEVKLDDNWSLRAEYRYLHFDVKRDEASANSQTQVQGTQSFTFGSNFTAERQTAADFHLGKVGVVYKFGGGGPASAMAAMPASLATVDRWAGFYFGAYFGAGAGDAKEDSASTQLDVDRTITPASTTTQTSLRSNFANQAGDMTGSMVDLFVGHNWRFGNVVVGGQVEGTVFSDVALKTIGTRSFTTPFVTTTVVGGVTTTATTTQSGFFTDETNQQLRSNVGVIGRIGYLVTPDILLYGLGGLALGNFVYPDADDRFGGKNSKWVAGYTAGAGGELKLTDNWSLRAEYRYLHYDVKRDEEDFDTRTTVAGTTTFTSLDQDAATRKIGADFHLGKVGVVYKFGAGPASAMAAMPTKAPPANCCDSWAGFYFGAYFGAGAGRVKETFTDATTDVFRSVSPATTTTSTTVRAGAGNIAGDMTGSMVDLFVGYNWRVGNFVVGGQVEGTLFSDVWLKGIGTRSNSGANTQVSTTAGVTTVTTTTFSELNTSERSDRLRSNVGLIGRAGFLVRPDVLLYGLGGLALGHFVYPDNQDLFGGKNSKWVAGYTAGAGGEVKLTDKWSLRAEYRYLHWDVKRGEDNSNASTTVQGTTTTTSNESFVATRKADVDFHVGKIGVVYKFCPGCR